MLISAAKFLSSRIWTVRRVATSAAALSATSLLAYAIVTNLDVVSTLHSPAREEHGDQAAMVALVQTGHPDKAFEMAFEVGNELFETRFNALDGVGANVGQGQRFTRVPRADLAGLGEWRNHVPQRETGPNAESCNACHRVPTEDGAGSAEANVHRDPTLSGNLGSFIQRNTPHVFAPGALQRLAEEMTQTLQGQLAQAVSSACANNAPATVALLAKGVSFGSLVVTPTGKSPCTTNVDTSGVVGIGTDLVVRPFQWKGSVAFLRDFNRGASHNEIGMQAVELVGHVDGDSDGVADEMTIGDQTGLAIYLAAQPRPTSKLELHRLGLLDPPLTSAEAHAIREGAEHFTHVGCASCHKPVLKIDDPNFSEPSQNPSYRDQVFPSGMDPVAMGVDPANPITFDLTADQPDNHVLDASGAAVFHLGALRKDNQGHALVELYSDLKRHDLGSGLAETIDEVGTGKSVFLTKPLWGLGTTAPYLHDGRATTVTEAILEHGGEAGQSKSAFVNLPVVKQKQLVAFLENLVLFKLSEE